MSHVRDHASDILCAISPCKDREDLQAGRTYVPSCHGASLSPPQKLHRLAHNRPRFQGLSSNHQCIACFQDCLREPLDPRVERAQRWPTPVIHALRCFAGRAPSDGKEYEGKTGACLGAR